MKRSCESFDTKTEGLFDLELPVENVPRTLRPLLPINDLVELCESLRKDLAFGLASEEERFKNKVDVEFVL